MRNMFVNRTSNALCRVSRVDDSFATLSIITPSPSKYMMPIKEYDSKFAEQWRPATDADIEGMDDVPSFRAPKNTPPDWA